MTGQVDEAGGYDPQDEALALVAVVAGLRTQLAQQEQRTRFWMDSRQSMLEALRETDADRDRLAGQVAAIRALHGKVPEPFLDGERYSCSTCTDGEGNAIDWPCPTLVVSSPTTPEAKK